MLKQNNRKTALTHGSFSLRERVREERGSLPQLHPMNAKPHFQRAKPNNAVEQNAPKSSQTCRPKMKLFSRLIFVCALLMFSTPIARAQNADDLRPKADAAFDEKSYARAVELYRQIKAAGPVRDEPIVNYRISYSLFKTEKWDDAIDSANYTLEHSDWKARVLYLLGQIYFKVPHQGYIVNDKIYRGAEYPEIEGAEKPTLQYLSEADQKKTLDYFEQAKVAAQKERYDAAHNRYFAPIYPITAREEIDLNFDLAAYLPSVEFPKYIQKVEAGGVGASAIDLAQNYDPSWILPHKVLYLYAEIRQLDEAKTKPDAARALLGEGLFVRAYRQQMDGWANKYDAELKKNIVRPYPYNDREAIPVWRRLITEYPNSDLAPHTLILIAQTQGQDSDLVKAAATYRELLQKYPKSKWVSDARAAIAGIEKHEVSFNLNEPARPGVQPKLSVQSRNVKAITFRAYRVQLEKYLLQPKNLKNGDIAIHRIHREFRFYRRRDQKIRRARRHLESENFGQARPSGRLPNGDGADF